MEICKQVYGEFSLLTSRLYINIGIVHEDNNDYVKAYEYFQKWGRVSEVVLGPEHPKTLRAKGVLKEPRYKLVAQRLKEQTDLQGQNNENNEEIPAIANGDLINQEVEQMLDNDELSLDNMEDDNEAAERGDNAELDLMNDELHQAINELLRRALGELDNRADVLQNILNSVHLTDNNLLREALNGEMAGGGGGGVSRNNEEPETQVVIETSTEVTDSSNSEDNLRDEHNEENL